MRGDLTEYPVPVIIDSGSRKGLSLRDGEPFLAELRTHWRCHVKILIRKRYEEVADLLILPARRRRLPPVMLRGVTKSDLRRRVAEVVDELSPVRVAG